MEHKKKILITAALIFMTACSGQQMSDQSESDYHRSGKQVKSPVDVEEKRSADPGKTGQPKEQETAISVKKNTRAKLEVTKEMSLDSANHVGGGLHSYVTPGRPEVKRVSPYPWNTESYTPVTDMGYINSSNDPLSTFSIDVDTASYSNIRRFVKGGHLPPLGAVRIEEMINYFSYCYPQPKNTPFSVSTEVGPSPWNPDYKLVQIGLKAREIEKKNLPPSNLVFLIDVSGSMRSPNKLPLLKKSMKMLVDQLEDRDRVSIVVYAGSDRIVLEPTSGRKKEEVLHAIETLSSGGSTHGSRGIITAYQLAEKTFMPGGNNRIILASDGDFNVGITTRGELIRLIEEKRKSGIYLTVLGFGMGNYHDDTMEILADKSNGNYGYIDTLLEAKKLMVKEMIGTMFTLAKDVKIQVEFNPLLVGAYRLVGYENRALADEDFHDDKKDAGEIGVGHTVTALYEIIPAENVDIQYVDNLKYQKVVKTNPKYAKELLTVKLRYKPLSSDSSLSFEKSVMDRNQELASTSEDFRFAAAVAAFGMELRGSEYLHGFTYPQILALAKGAKGEDSEGYRAEFIRLVEMSELL